MKAVLFDANGKEKGHVELPAVFSTKYSPDVIQRTVLSIMSKIRQPYGPSKFAGNRSSAHYHGMRHSIYSMMNKEMARMSRIHGTGGHMTLVARNVPQAIKGRKAHAPKIDKNWALLVNKKEKQLAVKSALAATADIDMVKARGHKINQSPIIFENAFEKIGKTKNAYSVLQNAGLTDELNRCGERKIRAGKGKLRGRKYKIKRGPLVIVSKKCELINALRNVPGVDVATAKDVDALQLAPGTHAGRFAVITEDALKELEKRFE